MPSNIFTDEFVGQNITVHGKIAEIVWQHMIQISQEFPIINYFDVDSKDQIVVYSKNALPKDVFLTLIGQLIVISGETKHPNPKYRQVYKEFQLFVENFHINSNNKKNGSK